MEDGVSQFTLIFSLATVAMLVLAGFIILFVVFYQKKMIQEQLKRQQLELDFQQKMMEATLESEENERRRLPTAQWERRFREKNIPIIGDDIKAQLGATIVHRVLSSLFRARGVSYARTYQLNTGGNTDFMNMLDRGRLASKKESKTEAVQSTQAEPLGADDIHIGPSDYIPWLNDNKLCFLRMEGGLFGDVPMNLELRLSVEDSPNSAAVVVDAIRCCKVALDRGVGGVLIGPSSFFCKHPPQQFSDDVAAQLTDEFIAGDALAAE